MLIVVDRTGMHLLPAVWCACWNASTEEMQALDMGLYPSTNTVIRTVFTFQCLDNYLADSQECNTSAYHYNEKLRRLTNSSFPQTAPVKGFSMAWYFALTMTQNRYQELMRIEREWRWIKNRMWHGFAHEEHPPGQGELTHICPCCPHPGVNLPENWEDEPHKSVSPISWYQSLIFILDGYLLVYSSLMETLLLSTCGRRIPKTMCSSQMEPVT